MKGVCAPNMLRTIIVVGLAGLILSGGPALAQDAETLYTKKCANCHAKDGSGHTGVTSKLEVPDLRLKRIVEMSDADIYNSIAHGTQHKGYPHAFLHIGITDEQIQGLVSYIRVLQRGNQQGAQRGTAKP